MTPENVLAMAKENKVKAVDVRFMDFPGIWQHFTIPTGELEAASFDEGLGFDGSSIRGWQPIHASDMLVIPDPNSAKMDPFFEEPTLVLIGNIADPVTREAYTRDPRNIAQKAEAYLKNTGIGDVAYFGPEAEFFIFDDVRFESSKTARFIWLTLRKRSGTPAETNARIWATKSAIRRDMFRFRPQTSIRICGRK